MRKRLNCISIFLIAISFCLSVYGEIDSSVRTVFLKTGVSFPVFGYWGDMDSGFKPSSDIAFMYIKDIDDTLSYGFQSGYSLGYKNRDLDMKVRIFSFHPEIFSWFSMIEKKYYLYLGPGIYQWTQVKSKDFSSTSRTEFGYNIGIGFLKEFKNNFRYGLNLELSHIFNIKTSNVNLDSLNNLSLNLVLAKKI